jgi:hypothetical protein
MGGLLVRCSKWSRLPRIGDIPGLRLTAQSVDVGASRSCSWNQSGKGDAPRMTNDE